ncbi:hypothetical protein QBZ16_000879 [Prototheca wickerhamii]|uniref:BZIP domain-containing protein n=1 Tax=Prototheca wickerhamii TaxID=3111 RepID=A0AAD9IDV1_PROWI|nr:hypothetical protein QBZ16_000879 [Prototheca wickerhamii]
MDLAMNITSDELIQNFFKTGSTVSLPRIDSESQFQEFMRKIPSATNLAAAMTDNGDGPHAQAAAAHHHHHHHHHEQAPTQPSGVPRVPSLDFIKAFLSASRPAPDHVPGSLFGPPPPNNVQGMPMHHGGVNLQQQQQQQQQAFELNGSVALALGRAKLEASAAEGGEGGGAMPASSAAGNSTAGSQGNTPTANGHDRMGHGAAGLMGTRHDSGPGGGLGSAASGALGHPPAYSAPALPIVGLQGGSGHHMVLNPNVLAAAFMQSQLGGMGGAGSGGYPNAGGGGGTPVAGAGAGGHPALSGGAVGRAGSALLPASSSDAVNLASAKQQVRRERRMLSNRESARRSRKRKQEHLQSMEMRLGESERAREEAVSRIAQLTEELRRRDAELGSLRVEVSSLRSALGENHPAVGFALAPPRLFKF